jgi:hypothetical protein
MPPPATSTGNEEEGLAMVCLLKNPNGANHMHAY